MFQRAIQLQQLLSFSDYMQLCALLLLQMWLCDATCNACCRWRRHQRHCKMTFLKIETCIVVLVTIMRIGFVAKFNLEILALSNFSTGYSYF